jgi:hypothetical protein
MKCLMRLIEHSALTNTRGIKGITGAQVLDYTIFTNVSRWIASS